MPVVVRPHGEIEQYLRQCRNRMARIEAEKLVTQRGKQQGRGLTDNAGDSQQNTGNDAGNRGPVHNGNRDPPAWSAERHRGLTQLIGDQLQHVVRRAHDQWQRYDRQRRGTGPGRKMPHGRHHDPVNAHADDDRRGRKQHIVDEPHDSREAPPRAELSQPGGGKYADRRTYQDAEPGYEQAAHHGVG